MIRQYPDVSLGPHRAQARDSDLRHRTVSRIQKAVLARLKKNVHGSATVYRALVQLTDAPCETKPPNNCPVAGTPRA